MNAVATTDDEALLRAVLANPADDAPRLVYADWLDERGDPRGEYLRVDLELSQTHRTAGTLGRATILRTEIEPVWAIAVSNGFCDLVKVLDVIVYETAGGPWRTISTVAPTWSQIEQAFRGLDRCLRPFIWLFFSEGEERNDGDHLNVIGGEGAWCFDGRLAGEAMRFENPDPAEVDEVPVWTSDQGATVPPHLVCNDEGTVVQAMKWGYYFGRFAPGVSWAVREW